MSLDHQHSDTGPFALIPAWLLDAKISDGALRQYAILARYADNDTLEAWPSRSTLAERQGCSVDTVDRRNRELVAAGALTVRARRRTDDGGDTSNTYTIARVRPGSREDAAPASREDAAPELEPPELEPNPAASQPRTRARTPRDDVWDALAEVFGQPGTASERSFFGKTVSELVSYGPEQVLLRAREARRRWPKHANVGTVAARWSSLGPADGAQTSRGVDWQQMHVDDVARRQGRS